MRTCPKCGRGALGRGLVVYCERHTDKGKGPSRWQWAWLLWLVAFLAVEIPAACRRAKLDTLSEHVSKLWFPRAWQRAVLAVFMLTLTSHFVFEWPGGLGVIVTGAPVGLIILLAVLKRAERPE